MARVYASLDGRELSGWRKWAAALGAYLCFAGLVAALAALILAPFWLPMFMLKLMSAG